MHRSKLFSLFLAGVLPLAGATFLVSPACGDEDWRTEFEAVCGLTDVSFSLSEDELRGLILQCDQLKSQIELEEATVRKVFLKRLQTCRDLFAYILESKNKESKPGESAPRSNEKSK